VNIRVVRYRDGRGCPLPEAGITVYAKTGGAHAFTTGHAGSSFPVYLARTSDLDQISAPDDSRLTRIGDLLVDSQGLGRLTFRVPPLPPDEYSAVILCRPCAEFSAGRSLLPAGPFRVQEAGTKPHNNAGSKTASMPAGNPTLVSLWVVPATLAMLALLSVLAFHFATTGHRRARSGAG
jgi:hypothetical protein